MIAKQNNIADASVGGSSKGVDHSKSTCSGEDIWKGPAKVTVDKTRYMNCSSTTLYMSCIFNLFIFSHTMTDQGKFDEYAVQR